MAPVVAESDEEERRYLRWAAAENYGWLHATALSLQHQLPQQSWCPELVSFGCHAGKVTSSAVGRLRMACRHSGWSL